MNIIYLGCNGFPFGFAEVQKQKMISKALINAGAKVTIISAKGLLKKSDHHIDIDYKGKVENINYFYSSFTPYRPQNSIYRNLLKIVGKFVEFFFILFIKKSSEKNIAIISSRNICALRYYHSILRITGYKIILSYEEYVKTLKTGNNGKAINLKFDDLANKYCDAILPISSFLENYQKKINPNIKMFKIPVLTDFDWIDSIGVDGKKNNTILFCGASAYFENIKFIIDSFEKVKNPIVELILIIHGNNSQNIQVSDYISKYSSKIEKIHIYSNLSFEDLIKLYKTSALLLIPLKPYERDIARFPHKISEYAASKTPILTTAVGEINNYFTNNVDSFISDNYNTIEYAEKIDFIFANKDLASFISQSSYNLGRKYFHYNSISLDLFNFCNNL